MIVKVCGNKFTENAHQVANLPLDFMGLIFYDRSPRNVTDLTLNESIAHFSGQKIGVFVNEIKAKIADKIKAYNLDGLQFHGNESVEECLYWKQQNLVIIKAFGLDENFDFSALDAFNSTVDYYLFDTKTPLKGGSGKKFDWQLLNQYQGKIPFILSGGIKSTDLDEILKINHPNFVGIDLNSGFEVSPGQKNISDLEKFVNVIKKYSRN